MNELLTVAEVADHLRTSKRVVYALIKEGRLPATNIGSDKPGGARYRVRRVDVIYGLMPQRYVAALEEVES